jgi:hypothetical protein
VPEGLVEFGLTLPPTDGCVDDAGGANERRTPLPDLLASCPPAVGAAASGVDDEPLVVEGWLGARIDPAGAELRDPRLEAPAPDGLLDALDELEPDELPPT